LWFKSHFQELRSPRSGLSCPEILRTGMPIKKTNVGSTLNEVNPLIPYPEDGLSTTENQDEPVIHVLSSPSCGESRGLKPQRALGSDTMDRPFEEPDITPIECGTLRRTCLHNQRDVIRLVPLRARVGPETVGVTTIAPNDMGITIARPRSHESRPFQGPGPDKLGSGRIVSSRPDERVRTSPVDRGRGSPP